MSGLKINLAEIKYNNRRIRHRERKEIYILGSTAITTLGRKQRDEYS